MRDTAAASPRERMRERLRFLYGQDAGDAALDTLGRVLDDFTAATSSSSRSAASLDPTDRFDQSDAVLITYGDTFLPDAAGGSSDVSRPLAALRAFAERHLDGLVSGDPHPAVLPVLLRLRLLGHRLRAGQSGAWHLGRRRSAWPALCADVRRGGQPLLGESAWFQAFLRGEPPYDRYFIVADPGTDLSGVTRPRTTPLLTKVETATGPACGLDDLQRRPGRSELRQPGRAAADDRGRPGLRTARAPRCSGWTPSATSGRRSGHPASTCRRPTRSSSCTATCWTRSRRDVAIVTETNVPHADNVSYFGDGHDEAQMVYQFPLAPLVLHALATGDASRLSGLGGGLETPSDATTFFNFLASHDGIGVVPARGILSDAEVAGAGRSGARPRRRGLEQDQPGRQREPVRAERHPLRHPVRPERSGRAAGS